MVLGGSTVVGLIAPQRGGAGDAGLVHGPIIAVVTFIVMIVAVGQYAVLCATHVDLCVIDSDQNPSAWCVAEKDPRIVSHMHRVVTKRNCR